MSEPLKPHTVTWETLERMFHASASIMVFMNDCGDVQVTVSPEFDGLPKEEQRQLFTTFIEAMEEIREQLKGP